MRRFAASASRRQQATLSVVFDLERRPAAARRDDVRVVDLEAGALEAFDVVDLGAEDELHRDLVDDDGDAVDGEDVVVVLGLVESQRVLEAGASTAADGDAQGLVVALLPGQKLADLGGGFVGEGDRCGGRVSHFTKCSGRPAEARRSGRCRKYCAPVTTSTETAVVCDSSQYLPAEVIAAKGIGRGQPLRLDRRRSAARDRGHRLRRLLQPAAPVERRRDHLAALGRRLHRRLAAAARRGQGDRLDPHLLRRSPAPSRPPTRRANG